MKILCLSAALFSGWLALSARISAAEAPESQLLSEFKSPSPASRPWVYWFWNNGNVNEKGIDADLTAMKESGLGGALIMDVAAPLPPPAGDADYMSPRWQSLMKYALRRARELGLEINLTNGPGWCGSSGPWITPELSMQTLVSTLTEVPAGTTSVMLPKPPAKPMDKNIHSADVDYPPFYRDIAVLAFPKRDGAVSPEEVLDLTKFMDTSGKLTYRFPEGEWRVQRIGHASTGASTRPPVKGGNGLEADKFSEKAMTVQFDNVIGMLAKALPVSKAGGLAATHVDSWEVGLQNWTPNFREEFKKRRGYDLIKYLPDAVTPEPLFFGFVGGNPVSGAPPAHPVGSPEEVERFRWDFYQTCSELLSEKYIGTLAKLANRSGLRLSLEGYSLMIGDEVDYASLADEPMTEFLSHSAQYDHKAQQIASVGHVMGRKVIGAEAFTVEQSDTWKLHPALLKAKGDFQFARGINRFVIHRYAMQPYMDRFPGVSMGPWGIHHERTNTWWPMSHAWHTYLARCQTLLREGLFVADALYLRHQRPNQSSFDRNPPLPPGYRSDEISAKQLIDRVSVKDGRLVLPDGMSYALLVLPDSPMTPQLVHKISELVEQGAAVYGPRPKESPSLSGYPGCDKAVADIAGQVWGDCDGASVTEQAFGKGRVFTGKPIEDVLASLTGGPDFESKAKLDWIHRTAGDREIYFVANRSDYPVIADAEFRVKGMSPQWWNPETGETRALGRVEPTERGVRVNFPLARGQSGFVVFEKEAAPRDYAVSVVRDGKPVDDMVRLPEVSITSATYGPENDPARTIDAKALVETQLREGDGTLEVAKLAASRDPAPGVVKTLKVAGTVDGKPREWSAIDSQRINLYGGVNFLESRTNVWASDQPDTVVLSSDLGGEFHLTSALGKDAAVTLPEMKKVELAGPWTVKFPPKWGAPDRIRLDKLASLSESEIEGVRHFSGICTYETTFDLPALQEGPGKSRYWLDLGELEVMGQVALNGQNLGTVWNRPSRVEVTEALKPGKNELVVQVANTWQNRMIGDSALPEGKRFTWSSWEPFKPDTPLPKSGLIGPVTLEPYREVEVKFE